MKLTVVIEHCPTTDQYVGFVPGLPGAHSQGKTLDRLMQNLKEVLDLLKEDGPLVAESDFIGLQTLEV
jgi:predicted RNase H-like HicB family nuclease